MSHRSPGSGYPVQTVHPSESMAAAARLMCEQGVGALVVTGTYGGTALCTITDRDMVCLVALGLDPEATSVDRFMNLPCLCNPPELYLG